MATNATTRLRAWNKAYTSFTAVKDRLFEAEPAQVDDLEKALGSAQDLLLDLPAPSLLAVIHKLSILWELDVDKPDKDGREKALILEDLGDLVAEGAAVLGMDRISEAAH